ncbi:MAG: hypothetical protein ACYC91_18485 [Solirubrobacteraceae bacterium]
MSTSISRSVIALAGAPVARNGNDRRRAVRHVVPLQLLEGRSEHRLEVPEVGRVDGELGGENELGSNPRPATGSSTDRFPRVATATFALASEMGPLKILSCPADNRQIVGVTHGRSLRFGRRQGMA